MMKQISFRHFFLLLFPIAASWIAIYLAKIEFMPHSIGFYELALLAGIISGLFAFLHRSFPPRVQHYTLIILPVILAFMLYARLGRNISIFSTFLPSIYFVGASFLINRYILYLPSLTRMRTLLSGLAGGALLSSLYAIIIQLMGYEIILDFWLSSFMNGLIIYVFTAFGISMADLIILKSEVKNLQNRQNNDLDDTDEDDDA